MGKISREKIISRLREIVGKEFVETDKAAIRLYSKEASGLEGVATAVVFPEKASEISEIVKFAYENDIKIYPQGSATDLAGAAIPEHHGIVISFDRMNKIKEYSIVDSYIIAEAGVRVIELNDLLAKEGYMFPVDPASMKAATVGGVIAAGGGGLRGALYGTMREWLMELTVVLPDENGTIIRVGCRTTKCRQGYDLVRLFAGSEGTLGIVTEATLKITPIPENIVTVAGFFETLENAMEAVVSIKRARIAPYAMEFIDSKTVEMGKQGLGLDWDVKGNMLIVSVAGPVEVADKYVETLSRSMEEANAYNLLKARSQDEAEELRIFELRRACYPSAIQLAAKSMNPDISKPLVLIEDIAVPPTKLPETVKKLRALEEKYKLPLAIFGHVGDGNLHPTTWIDATDEEAKKKVWEMFDEIMEVALSMGGTISAEHGIGLHKKKGLEMEMKYKGSEKALELMRSIKKIFDPKNILNPGKVI